jgi:hypothetical protein
MAGASSSRVLCVIDVCEQGETALANDGAGSLDDVVKRCVALHGSEDIAHGHGVIVVRPASTE